MCCRYYMEMSPELKPIVDEAMRSSLGDRMVRKLGRPLKTSGEIFPTDIVPVIAPDKNGQRAVFPMIWGFKTQTGSSMFNARLETASVKPSFRDAWKNCRCIIPASWYYEWQHFVSSDGKEKTGDKFMIQPKGQSMTCLAGLYKIEDGFPYFTVLTREPSSDMKLIHDRMPLILPPEWIDDWIRPDGDPDRVKLYGLLDMICEKTV